MNQIREKMIRNREKTTRNRVKMIRNPEKTTRNQMEMLRNPAGPEMTAAMAKIQEIGL